MRVACRGMKGVQMKAAEALKQGRLAEALKAAEDGVRNEPASGKARVLLSQVLAVMGVWDRCAAQLEVAGKLEAGNLLMASVCRHLVTCEGFRRDVFAGKRQPLLMGEPEAWVAMMVQALGQTAGGQHAAAAALRARALEEAPARGGTINGQRFEWAADADSRLGPILEVMVDAKYYWVPMTRVASVKVEPPADLRDVVWAPATFAWTTGATQEGFIPTRYVGSESAEDDMVRLSRKTAWAPLGGDATGEFAGLGQRMLATDGGEVPILEVRSLVFDPVEGGDGHG